MALPRHKREPNARKLATLTGKRAIRLAAGAAVVATVPAVGLGVLIADPAATDLVAAQHTAPLSFPSTRQPVRESPVSRTLDRTRLLRSAQAAAGDATAAAIAGAHTLRWTVTGLNLWVDATAGARKVGEIAVGHHVLITGRSAGHRVEVVVQGKARWVTAGYLSDSKPARSASTSAGGGLSMAPCPDPSVEYRLTTGAVFVYRSVCHAFPQITAYGGWAARGEHASGKALDIMTSDVALGNAIAAFLQAHASQLHVYDILWQQHIWTPVRASEGWRLFPDRGSPTANHDDHVHVSVY